MTQDATRAPGSGSSVTWANIGKVGTVIGLIIAAFTLYNLLFPDKAHVVALCQMYQVPTKPDVPQSETDRQDLPQDQKTPSRSDKKVSDKGAKEPKDPKEPAHLHLKFEGFGFLSDPVLILKCDISNSGKQEAKEVTVDLAFSPEVAKLNGKVLPAEKMAGQNSLNIGELRPRTKATLLVWGHHLYLDSIDSDSYAISFSGGVGELMLPTLAYGVSGKIARFWDIVSENPFIAIFFLPMVYAFIQFIHVSRRLSPLVLTGSEGPVSSIPMANARAKKLPGDSTPSAQHENNGDELFHD